MRQNLRQAKESRQAFVGQPTNAWLGPLCRRIDIKSLIASSVARLRVVRASPLNWPDWRLIRTQGLEPQNNKTGEN
ncbi:conserved hypothetical protein [Mesorhizobium prunaredense]|uniref:Uncharacterized protein n=1 Tax=Mesorhizobium prunaredense TaxID=1631249 RepID=A0A1R3V0A1_9HYPH|nr:conserved hypothetical protein [Mesorhizobium prunaredense]